MIVLICMDYGKDLHEAFEYLLEGISGYSDNEKWKIERSHYRIAIKSKTYFNELRIIGRRAESCEIRGLNPNFFYTTSPSAREYLEFRGGMRLYSLEMVKALMLYFIKEE